MENKYQTDQGKYLHLAEMSIDERLLKQSEKFTPMGCKCKGYPCKPCRNRLTPSLDELDEAKLEKLFSDSLAA